MSSATPGLAVGETSSVGASPGEAAPASEAGSAGFLALIGALLQESGPALVASTATTETTGVPAAIDSDDEASDEADAATLLASLAFAQGAITNAPRPMPPPPAAPSAEASAGAIGLDSAARRSATSLPAAIDGAAEAIVGDPGNEAPVGTQGGLASPRGLQARDGASAFSQSLGGLFAPADGAVESLATREEGAAPRSAVTSAAGSPPSPGTLLTAVSNLVNGDVAVARGATAAQDAPLREQLGTPRWQEELGNRITLMAAQGQHSGSLRLNPEHLGPVEVQITVGEERTHVQFGAQNADTRQALQDALPRLREMFASAGLQLGQAGVSHQSPRQRPDGAPGASGGSTGGISGIGDGEPTHLATPVRRITHSGLLDTYA